MHSPLTPDGAWRRLLDGNARYVTGDALHAHQDHDRRLALADRQTPFALVLGCSDSRAPAEVLFDQGLGDLFVVRTAGHILDSAVLGSVEFGVDVLEIPLVLVLGHTRCGAVRATLESIDRHRTPAGYLRDVVERVSPAVFEARRDPDAGPDEITAENVRHTCLGLREKSAVLTRAVELGRTAIVGAVYDVVEGHVTPVVGEGTVTLGD